MSMSLNKLLTIYDNIPSQYILLLCSINITDANIVQLSHKKECEHISGQKNIDQDIAQK